MDGDSARTKKKNNRKGQTPKKKAHRSKGQEDEENGYGSDSDCASVTSFASTIDSEYPFDGDADENGGAEHIEDFEGKLLDHLEGCRQKSSKLRLKSLTEVKKAMCRRHIDAFILERKESILDMLERLLKRGNSDDKVWASQIVCTFCSQLGDSESLHVFNTLKAILTTLSNDMTETPAARSNAILALGMACFIGAEEPSDNIDCLRLFKALFSKKLPTEATHHQTWAAAVNAWGLILTVVSQNVIAAEITDCINPIVCLLESGDLNLRIAAGEATALVYELSKQNRVTFTGSVNTLQELLKELANESGRHKGKREKKQQKSSFRDILKGVQAGFVPEGSVQFGQECIDLYNWSRRHRYHAFKDALGSGTVVHLKNNMLLRDIFDLGVPVSDDNIVKETKDEKLERQYINAAMSKDRALLRNRRRDNKHSAGLIDH